jgi:RNA polymerase sigma-70 factor (ECF subfamily)
LTGFPETEESIDQLAAKAQAGCLVSFERIVQLNKDRLFTYLVQLLGNAHDAEDVTQEAFVKAYRNLHSFNGKARFTTWLFAIAKNTALTQIRRRKPLQSIDGLEETIEAPQPHDPAEAESIWRLARKLKPKFYETLWLFYAEGFSLKETAEILNTNAITVRVNLHRARAALATRLRALDYEGRGS